jgi:molecular chaperone GrpE
VPVSRKLQTGGREALGSEEPHRWEEKKPFKDEPFSQDGLSTRYEQGEDGSETAKKVTQEEIPALSKELEAVRRERDEYLDNMRRMKAELENSRARMEREHARSVELASERLVKELLPILDNLERALEADGDIREGVEATREQLVGILAQEGSSPISSEGQNFDPAVHEALMSKPSDEHEEDTIIQTLERGYVLNGKPIRPAKVVVSKRA